MEEGPVEGGSVGAGSVEGGSAEGASNIKGGHHISAVDMITMQCLLIDVSRISLLGKITSPWNFPRVNPPKKAKSTMAA